MFESNILVNLHEANTIKICEFSKKKKNVGGPPNTVPTDTWKN